ncbi:hypothetical protein C8A01DRAFT_19875, partial [Parachaetomium inaequale]
SVITDLGEQISELHKRRTNSDPTSADLTPGGLGSQLIDAISRSDPYRPGFLSKGQLHKLVNKDAVEKELLKCETSLRRRLQTLNFRPSVTPEALEATALTICGKGEQSWPAYIKPEDQSPTHRHLPTEKRFQKIMAVLLLIERPSRIGSLMQEGICDADLPLVLVPTVNKPFKRWALRRRKDRDTHLQCFANWRQRTMALFEQRQWAVLAPFFARDLRNPKKVPHYFLPDQVIMPFRSWGKVGQGGFGEVYKTEIHPDHHDFNHSAATQAPGSKPDLFAVKILRSTEEAEFKKEVEILKRVSRSPHVDLITLLVTYEYQGRYHLMLPLAEADLLTYWENTAAENDKSTASWLAEQCRGLAEGLMTIHRYRRTSTDSILENMTGAFMAAKGKSLPGAAHQGKKGDEPRILYCRHGDIKPENILWFPSPAGPADEPAGKGILKITDFGVAEFTTQDTAPRAHGLPVSPMYQPPEAYVPLKNGVIRTSYDIWGLGCIYLEFITWFFGGWKYISNFLDRRMALDNVFYRFNTGTFFCIEKDDATGFIDELHSHQNCTEFIHEFLLLIKEDMLVVEGEGCHARMSASGVQWELAKMQQRDSPRSGYFSRSAAWPPPLPSANDHGGQVNAAEPARAK